MQGLARLHGLAQAKAFNGCGSSEGPGFYKEERIRLGAFPEHLLKVVEDWRGLTGLVCALSFEGFAVLVGGCFPGAIRIELVIHCDPSARTAFAWRVSRMWLVYRQGERFVLPSPFAIHSVFRYDQKMRPGEISGQSYAPRFLSLFVGVGSGNEATLPVRPALPGSPHGAGRGGGRRGKNGNKSLKEYC